MNLGARCLDSNPDPRYSIGDIIRGTLGEVNYLILGITQTDKGPAYSAVELRFPDELLVKRHKSGIIMWNEFVPDFFRHSRSYFLVECIDPGFHSRKIGHIDLDPDISNLKDTPLLHAIPELRDFYEGAGYYQ